MAIDRKQFTSSELSFFKAFDHWQLKDPTPDIFKDWMQPGEAPSKAAAHAPLLEKAKDEFSKKLDPAKDWDKLVFEVLARLQTASLYYLFTGDKAAIAPALEALELLEACKRPYWTFSSCIGVLDMDLRTGELVRALALMKSAMGEALEPSVHRRLKTQVVDRILKPGLEAERNKTYPWMHSRANWRIILTGCFAEAAMVFHADCPFYRELIEYAIEGNLACLATGDAAGGWNEGPGYWDYGLQYAVSFTQSLKTFTSGKVDLFRHPFLKKTGDFYLLMHTKKDEIWNWSDASKKVGPSLTLAILARAYRNPAYQWMASAQGVKSLMQLHRLDSGLKPEAPPAGRPVSQFFPGLGILVWRGGFGARDSYIGVKAGDIPHFNHHCQMDFGSLVIHAEGRELLAEVDKWPYPYEGKKDPKVKGAQPGYYDIPNKRWMRWDFDYVGATGHSMVTLEGGYPKPSIGAEARILSVRSGGDVETAVIDSTSVYKPLASRVRRFIVFLRPDVVLLVDEIRSREPVRARVQFQPGGRVERGGDRFSIVNGPAMLTGASLCPNRADNLILGLDDRKTTYLPPGGLLEKQLRTLYIENLCRKPRLVFVTALQFGKKGFAPATYALDGAPLTDDAFRVIVKRERRTSRAAFNLARGSVETD